MSDAETRRAIEQLARELSRVQADVRKLQRGTRTPQLGNSSTDGSIAFTDPESEQVRLRIGRQPDGRLALVASDGDPPPAPSAPGVASALAGLRVTWDGSFTTDQARPSDFDHVAVHVSTVTGFTPSAETYVGSITQAGDGGMLPVVPLPYTEHYVRLVGVTTSGVAGNPSPEVAATPLRVDSPDLSAGSVTAATIAAGAVEADKLAAILVLATRILAGDPAGARVELSSTGLRAYNAAGETTVAVDAADGSAAFTGTISGSDILGSRIILNTAGGTGAIEAISDTALHAALTSAVNSRVQMRADEVQAEWAAFADVTDLESPHGSTLAQPDKVQLIVNSDVSGVKPTSLMGVSPTQAYQIIRAVRGNLASPSSQVTATETAVTQTWNSGGDANSQLSASAAGVAQRWESGSGSALQISAIPDHTQMTFQPPDPALGSTAASEAALFSFRSSSGDQPQAALQSPYATEGTAGVNRRSSLTVTGAQGTEYPTARVLAYGNEILVGNDFDATTSAFSTDDGQVRLVSTHSILSERHRPVISNFVTYSGIAATSESFVAFTGSQWPALSFRTSASGWVEVTICLYGTNSKSVNALLAVSFALSGASSLSASRARATTIRAAGSTGLNAVTASTVVPLELVANADYTLTPCWYKSSGTWGTDVTLDADAGPTYISVKPLT